MITESQLSRIKADLSTVFGRQKYHFHAHKISLGKKKLKDTAAEWQNDFIYSFDGNELVTDTDHHNLRT